MRYFTYIAEQSFKTSPSGERVFYSSGPWSRPYILPDAETEQRIYKKLVWMLRIVLGALIVTQPILVLWFPAITRDPVYFAFYVVGLVAAFGLARYLLLRSDLRRLGRASTRLPLRSFYAEMAQKHSSRALALGLVCSILFVVVGGAMLAIGESRFPAIFCMVFFGGCSVAWIYALALKRARAG
jgi:hypothetical protein